MHPAPRLLFKASLLALALTMLAGTYGWLRPDDQKLGWGFFGNDLMPSYSAGKMVREGHADEIYNPYAVKRVVRDIWTMCYPGEPAKKGLAPWLNPPAYVLPFVALSALPYLHAMFVWIGVNIALTLSACVLLMKLLPAGTSWKVRALVPMLLLTSFPYLQATCHQQNTFLSLAILSATVSLTVKTLQSRGETRQPIFAYATGAVAGLLFFKPQLGLVVALALSVAIGYRALIGAAIMGSLMVAVGEWALPGSLWPFVLQMPESVRLVMERDGYHWQRQTNFFGFWRLLIQDSAAGPAWTVTKLLTWSSVACVLAALAWAGRVIWRAGDDRATLRWLAAAVVAMPLIMPYYMDYDLLLLAVSLTLVAKDVIAAGGLAKSDRWFVRASLALAAILPFEPIAGQLLGVNIVVIALTGLLVVLVRRVKADAQSRQNVLTLMDDNPIPTQLRVAA